MNEELIGETLVGQVDTFIVTKFGLVEDTDGRLKRDSAPAAVRKSVERSLHRLKRERIDLLLQHRPDPKIPDEVLAGLAADLVREGKIGAFGLSSTDADRLRRFRSSCPVTAVQNELSLIISPDIGAMPEEFAGRGAVYMAYAPLGRGLLTTAAPRIGVAQDDYRSRIDVFGVDRRDRVAKMLEQVGQVAARQGAESSVVALAWVLQHGRNVVAIPGAKSPEQVDASIKAAGLALSASDISILDQAGSEFRLAASC